MNKNFLKLIIFTPFICFCSAYAASHGTEGGGGGDVTEMRVDEIRGDILKWIQDGGGKELIFPEGLDYASYRDSMASILRHQAVVVSIITTEQEKNAPDPEHQVILNGHYKSCRGFYSSIDNSPRIICNKERFVSETASDQYKLIHHEYAGLVRIEKNIGAASDYTLSKQLTDYLKPTLVLKLSITKNPYRAELTNSFKDIMDSDGNLYGPSIGVGIDDDPAYAKFDFKNDAREQNACSKNDVGIKDDYYRCINHKINFTPKAVGDGTCLRKIFCNLNNFLEKL